MDFSSACLETAVRLMKARLRFMLWPLPGWSNLPSGRYSQFPHHGMLGTARGSLPGRLLGSLNITKMFIGQQTCYVETIRGWQKCAGGAKPGSPEGGWRDQRVNQIKCVDLLKARATLAKREAPFHTPSPQEVSQCLAANKRLHVAGWRGVKSLQQSNRTLGLWPVSRQPAEKTQREKNLTAAKHNVTKRRLVKKVCPAAATNVTTRQFWRRHLHTSAGHARFIHETRKMHLPGSSATDTVWLKEYSNIQMCFEMNWFNELSANWSSCCWRVVKSVAVNYVVK